MTLTRWQHPTMGEFTFQDVRPGRQQQQPDITQPDITQTAEFKTIVAEMETCPRHEAAHAAVGTFLEFKVTEARADIPGDGAAFGHVQFDFSGEDWTPLRLASYAVTLLAGPMGEKGHAFGWPLGTDRNAMGDEQQLANVITQLNLNQEQYDGLVGVTRKIVEHTGIKRAIDYIETMLGAGLVLDKRMVAELYKSALDSFGLPEPETKSAAPTVAELNRMMADLNDELGLDLPMLRERDSDDWYDPAEGARFFESFWGRPFR